MHAKSIGIAVASTLKQVEKQPVVLAPINPISLLSKPKIITSYVHFFFIRFEYCRADMRGSPSTTHVI